MLNSRNRDKKTGKNRVGAKFIFARFLGGGKLHPYAVMDFGEVKLMTPPTPSPTGEETLPLLVGEGWGEVKNDRIQSRKNYEPN